MIYIKREPTRNFDILNKCKMRILRLEYAFSAFFLILNVLNIYKKCVFYI